VDHEGGARALPVPVELAVLPCTMEGSIVCREAGGVCA
jgi:hypothetical protein